MSLPSQNARIIGTRATVMSRRRRRRRGRSRLPRILLAALAAFGIWLFWPAGGPSEAERQAQAASQETGLEGGEAGVLASNQRTPTIMQEQRQEQRPAESQPAPVVQPVDRTAPTRPLPPPVVIDQTGVNPSLPGRGTITGSLPHESPAPRTSPAQTQPQTQNQTQAPAQAQRPGQQPSATNSDGSVRYDSPQVARLALRAEQEIARANPIEGRKLLSDALRDPSASLTDRRMLRERLTALNEDLVFGPRVTPGDPIAFSYEIQRGDVLSTLVRRQKLGIDWRLITHVNRLERPERIRAGQRIKLVRGPFHAVVSKNDYRLDLYWGDPDRPSDWLFIRSFPVGLGEDDGTPIGTFVVRSDSRLVNPAWTNPRTGERFAADDPKNPIGEYWIGLDGVGAASIHTGYGIHGTIEPDSIGSDRSMGCVRMLDEDIKLLYGMLAEGPTRVVIQP